MKEEDYRPDTSATGGFHETIIAEDGSYRIVRPETGARSYTDAHFQAADDLSDVPPRYYEPEPNWRREKKTVEKPKKGGFARMACLALVCSLMGGLFGAGVATVASNRGASEPEALVETAAAPSVNTVPGAAVNTAATGGNLSAGEIYAIACQQVVGITTEVTATNFFGQTSSSAVAGTGFIIREDGYILTNNHVVAYAVQGGYDVTVVTYDGTEYDAKIVGADEGNDIAVLKIDAEGLNPVTFADSDSIAVGDTVYAVGNPLGELDFTMTTGLVSALDRTITTDESYVPINMFQIDAAVNPGNSGGPVYNAAGQVIGVVTAKTSATGVEGLGFAVPANDAVNIANELMENGFVISRVQLGIDTRTLSSSAARYYGQGAGVYVVSVKSGSCAEAAGLKPGDIITAVEGKETPTYEALKTVLRGYTPGDVVDLTIYRNDEEHTVSVTLDAADENSPNNQRGSE
ncbi:MAG: trypsin-like peptidase domain-containing protein [Oscillospiraceae bacterium]|nr:trypsin-like peptidase domain-containing protein [Oscillospiraceae bacterium]